MPGQKRARVSEEKIKLLLIQAVVAQLPTDQAAAVNDFNRQLRLQVGESHERKIAVRLAMAQWAAGVA